MSENGPAFCIHCGGALRPSAKFCPKCGQPVQPRGQGAVGAPAAGAPRGMPSTEKAGAAHPQPASVYTPVSPVEPSVYPQAETGAPPEGSDRQTFLRKPLFWVAVVGLSACLICALAAVFAIREVGDIFDFGDEIETIGSMVPDLEGIATQIPEIEDIATQIPEIETIATDLPEIEELATGLPGLEDLATDLPLPDLEIELPSE